MSYAVRVRMYGHSTTQCNTLHYTATHSNTVQHSATHCNTLHRTATHCSTLQHTATHCNTLQHTAICRVQYGSKDMPVTDHIRTRSLHVSNTYINIHDIH